MASIIHGDSDGEQQSSIPPFTDTDVTTGIILRTSAASGSRYAYFPIPIAIPATTNLAADTSSTAAINAINAILAASVEAAPHFPQITILDCASTFLLYETYNTFPHLYHVYHLITARHHPIVAPPSCNAPVAAGLVLCRSSHFKVLLVSVNQHHNHLASDFDSVQRRLRPSELVFEVYSSEVCEWRHVTPSPSDAGHFSTLCNIMRCRRRPVHAGGIDTVYLDLTDVYLVRFNARYNRIRLVPKRIFRWESVDETRYGECRGRLHCVKMNPELRRLEIYEWDEEGSRKWEMVLAGGDDLFNGRVAALSPDTVGCVIQRTANDEVSVNYIKQQKVAIIIGGRGPECANGCLSGSGMVVSSEDEVVGEMRRCFRCHPHENVGCTEAEVFPVRITS